VEHWNRHPQAELASLIPKAGLSRVEQIVEAEGLSQQRWDLRTDLVGQRRWEREARWGYH